MPRVALLLATAALIQMRLLCNLLDGMVAVEFGKKTKSGEIYNDLPDRISDALTLIPAGYLSVWVSWGPELGWAAGLLAVMTAYVRMLGASLGSPHYFLGPMAKQHRMAVMTAACLLSAVEVGLGWRGPVFTVALMIIVLGSLYTVFRRVHRIYQDLESR